MADDAALCITVEYGQLAAAIKGRRWVESVVCTVGLATACMSVASAIYKAPAGVFGGHKCAYYVSVVSAGVVGLAEACTAAVWLSGAVQDGRRQLLARRCVMGASLLPLAFVAGIGGAGILLK